MTETTVALVPCENYDPNRVAHAIAQQFGLLGGVERFVRPGDTVLVKPNLIAPRSHRQCPAQTHPEVILAVVRFLKDFGARPFVGDSSAWANAATCIRALELTEPLARLGVPVRQLDNPKKCRLGPGKTYVRISKTALEADVIVNLPKFKAHQQLMTTFAVKNLFGCVSGKRKALWHFRRGGDVTGFCELLIDIYRYLRPALTIVDGIVAMEGQGPIRGTNKPLGWLVGGTDPIAVETVCGRLVNLAPQQIPIVRTARQMGFGCAQIERIDVAGDALPTEPCTDFQLAEQVPIQFTFGRVCRSIARQIAFVARHRRRWQCEKSDRLPAPVRRVSDPSA